MIINRLFIANRGEIASRIIRTCKRLGIETVLGVSEADRNSVPARQAEFIEVLGPPPSTSSYLDVERVVEAARHSQCDAIHPGYGFLSENQSLARACQQHGIIFIGPTIEQLQALGDKLVSRENAIAAGLEVVPGGSAESPEQALELATSLKWPVLIKAVGGGGGRGMKIVHSLEELVPAMSLASSEASKAFADARVYLEHYVTEGRHIEVQVLGDGNNIIHLGTRDCSIQRRYQKLIEEAPAPDLDPAVRQAIETAAVNFARHLDYRGAGTVEFLLDCNTSDFYFLEMNARIQVEHPVTETITGIDLVAEQIRVAEGRPVTLTQEDVIFEGHAIECRINAEDSEQDFMPCPGTVNKVVFPAGNNIRIDSHMENGAVVPPFYDSMIAKLIVKGEDRKACIANMQKALHHLQIEGIKTNLPMHIAIMGNRKFAEAAVSTGFLTSAYLQPAEESV